MTDKSLEDYSIDDYRRLRKGAFLLTVVTFLPTLVAIYLIFYMETHHVPQSKTHAFAMLCTSTLLVGFATVIQPKSLKVSKLLKLHPEWKKAKIMTAKLSSELLTQLILLPLGLLLILIFGFNRFYQPERVIDTHQQIPAVEIPETSYHFETD